MNGWDEAESEEREWVEGMRVLISSCLSVPFLPTLRELLGFDIFASGL